MGTFQDGDRRTSQTRVVAGVEAGIPPQNANPPIDNMTRNGYPLPAFDKAFLQLDSFHAGY